MRLRPASAIAGLGLAAALGAFGQPSPAPLPAFAAPNLGENGARAMAWSCAACHGTGGRAAPGSAVPGLAGRPANQIEEAMRQFREGRRPATVMHQIAKGFGEAEIAAMAAYFSKQPL